MADIALRNPQFKSITIQASGTLSVVCEVSIDTVLRYTLIKNVEPSTTVNFDVAELARDYIEIEYQTDYIPQTVAIKTVITPYDGLNGTGNALPLLTVTYDDVGFEAYGTFEEGVNPEVPFGRTLPTLLIPINEDTDEFTILAPNNRTGKIPYLTSSFRGADAYTGTDTSVTIQGVDCTIKRIDCTKYGDGKRIIYINKYGAQQDLWFFLKETRNLARTNEGYKSNTITYPSGGATYNIQNAPNKVFNTQAKQTHTLSSGYYPEFLNQQFEELLLSEYVWLSTVKKGSGIVIPVKVKDAAISFKTTLNDKLIEYTMVFEEAYDYINNIR
ncbi:hypothetical protein [uncultured Wocania sp.]|uniref:hypothetical protein n=1 Tax=uncultured Wocania sp. TaxID=2834404 RepID=UPI0030F52606